MPLPVTLDSKLSTFPYLYRRIFEIFQAYFEVENKKKPIDKPQRTVRVTELQRFHVQ
jgi:hypothetical protein